MMLNVESANGMDMPNVKEVCGSLSAYIINKVKKPVDMLQGYYPLRVGETGSLQLTLFAFILSICANFLSFLYYSQN